MAELLILNFDTTAYDSSMENMAWKKGHVIDVKPDGHQWGTEEQLPKFVRMRITNMSVSEANEYLEKIDDVDTVPVHIRAVKFDFNDPLIPTNIKNAFNQNAVLVVTKAAVQNFFKTVS